MKKRRPLPGAGRVDPPVSIWPGDVHDRRCADPPQTHRDVVTAGTKTHDTAAMNRTKRFLLCLLGSLVLAHLAPLSAAKGTAPDLYWRREDTQVRVRRAGQGGFGGVLEVYTRADRRRDGWVRRFKFYQEGTGIESVVPWVAPVPGLDPQGVAFKLTFSTGSGWEYIIVANLNGRWRIVLHVVSEGGQTRNPEFVDLDGDGYPEVVNTDWYRYNEDAQGNVSSLNPDLTVSEAWKWFPARSTYTRVRTSSYRRRLLPLHLSTVRGTLLAPQTVGDTRPLLHRSPRHRRMYQRRNDHP